MHVRSLFLPLYLSTHSDASPSRKPWSTWREYMVLLMYFQLHTLWVLWYIYIYIYIYMRHMQIGRALSCATHFTVHVVVHRS